MLNASDIGKKIKRLRESVSWTQSDLARHINISSAAVSMIERLERLPCLMTAYKIAKAFNISLDELLDNNYWPLQETSAFVVKFGDIQALYFKDQELLRKIINRLKEKL